MKVISEINNQKMLELSKLSKKCKTVGLTALEKIRYMDLYKTKIQYNL